MYPPVLITLERYIHTYITYTLADSSAIELNRNHRERNIEDRDDREDHVHPLFMLDTIHIFWPTAYQTQLSPIHPSKNSPLSRSQAQMVLVVKKKRKIEKDDDRRKEQCKQRQ